MGWPSKYYFYGVMTAWSWTIAVIALLAVLDSEELLSMATELVENKTSSIVAFCVFGFVGALPLLIEMRRKKDYEE